MFIATLYPWFDRKCPNKFIPTTPEICIQINIKVIKRILPCMQGVKCYNGLPTNVKSWRNLNKV